MAAKKNRTKALSWNPTGLDYVACSDQDVSRRKADRRARGEGEPVATFGKHGITVTGVTVTRGRTSTAPTCWATPGQISRRWWRSYLGRRRSGTAAWLIRCDGWHHGHPWRRTDTYTPPPPGSPAGRGIKIGHVMAKAKQRTRAAQIQRERSQLANAMRVFAENHNYSRNAHARLRKIIAVAEPIVENTVSPLRDGDRQYRPEIVVHAMSAILAARSAIKAINDGDAKAASADSMKAIFEYEAARVLAQRDVWLRGYWVAGLKPQQACIVELFQTTDICDAASVYRAYSSQYPNTPGGQWHNTLRKALERLNSKIPGGIKIQSVGGTQVRLFT